ncbi:MAG: hypothetical protein JRG73_12275 [Deltaproteobacteria bacterium]|nr:hypothetical protein [Deltaproteobacteria bacterium]
MIKANGANMERHWLMELYHSGEDPEKILALCRASLEDSPLSLDKRTLLGMALQKLGRIEEARREFEHVERLIRRGDPVYLLLADIEKQDGKLRQAARRYIQALACDSRNDECWSKLSEINAAMAESLRQVFKLIEEIEEEQRDEHELPAPAVERSEGIPPAIPVEREKPGPEQILTALEAWLATIRRNKSALDTGASS